MHPTFGYQPYPSSEKSRSSLNLQTKSGLKAYKQVICILTTCIYNSHKENYILQQLFYKNISISHHLEE